MITGWPGRAFGRNPARFDARATFHSAATALGPVPDIIDWSAMIDGSDLGWGMYANDTYGDCFWAAVCHACLQTYAYASGNPTLEPIDDDALRAYASATGASLQSPPGSGTYISGPGGGLEWLSKNGMIVDGVHFAFSGFPSCDPHDTATVRQIVHTYGGAILGINLCDAAENDGFVFSTYSQTIVGGHAIWLNKVIRDVDDYMYEFVSWGAKYRMNEAYFKFYVEEVAGLYIPQSINDRGVDGAGVPKDQLEAGLGAFQSA